MENVENVENVEIGQNKISHAVSYRAHPIACSPTIEKMVELGPEARINLCGRARVVLFDFGNTLVEYYSRAEFPAAQDQTSLRSQSTSGVSDRGGFPARPRSDSM
jgi:hypothetical protein